MARTTRKSRRRSLIVAAVLGILLITVAGLELALDAERYRPRVLAAIERNANRPATVGYLDIGLLPVPHFTAEDIRVGDDTLWGRVDRVTVYPRLRDLLRLKVVIDDVDVEGAAVYGPADIPTIVQALKTVGPQSDTPRERKYLEAVNRVWIPGARLYLGDGETPAAVLDVELHDTLSPEIAVRADGTFGAFGAEARIKGDAAIRPAREGAADTLTYSGKMYARRLDLAVFDESDEVPRIFADVEVNLTGHSPSHYEVAIDGVIEPEPGAPAPYPSAKGRVDGRIVYANQRFTFDGVHILLDAGEARGGASQRDSGGFDVWVEAVNVAEPDLVLALLAGPDAPFSLHSADDTIMRARDIKLYTDGQGWPELHGGEGLVAGVEARRPDGTPILHNLRAELRTEGERLAFRLEDGAGLEAQGTLTPDTAEHRVGVALAGKLPVTRELLVPFFDLDSVPGLSGALDIESFSATFARGGGIPADLSVTGALNDGHLAIDTSAYTDAYHGITASFTTQESRIAASLQGQSEKLGPVSVEGTYAAPARRLESLATADLGSARLTEMMTAAAARWLAPVLAAYGTTTANVALGLPTATEPRLHLTVKKDGDLPVALDATWGRQAPADDEGTPSWPLVTLQVEAVTVAPAVAEATGWDLTAEGLAGFDLTYARDSGVFDGALDLEQARVTIPPYIDKAASLPAAVRMTGTDWTPESLTVAALGEQIEAAYDEGNWRFESIAVDAGAIAPLFHWAAHVSGRITGQADTAPTNLRLAFHDLHLALGDAPPLETVNGGLRYRDGWVALDNLHVTGEGIDVRIDGRPAGGGWRGTAQGPLLDLNAFASLYTAYRGTGLPGSGAAGGAGAVDGTRDIQLDAALDEVRYRRGTATEFATSATVRGDATRLTDLRFVPGTGTATGAITFASREGQGTVAEAEIALDGADAAFIDAIAFEEPRSLGGRVTGTLALTVPLAGYANAVDGTSGRIEIQARKGTLGKLGLVTKLLTVLRTGEILWLRLPPLKDEGLTYDSLTMTVDMDQGVAMVSDCELRSPTLAFNAEGGIDFPNDNVDLRFRVFPLEVVTGLAEKIPILGEVAGAVRSIRGVRLFAKGPVNDPNISLVRGEEVQPNNNAAPAGDRPR